MHQNSYHVKIKKANAEKKVQKQSTDPSKSKNVTVHLCIFLNYTHPADVLKRPEGWSVYCLTLSRKVVRSEGSLESAEGRHTMGLFMPLL